MENSFEDKLYRSRCSEKTLQSCDKGFFLNFVDHVAEVVGESWIENTFGKLKTDNERVRIIFEQKKIRNVIHGVLGNVQEIYRKKSSEVSHARRSDAEKCLKQGNNLRSLMMYSQSVLRAEGTGKNLEVDNGKTLSLALWGRAQLLISLKMYKYAISDIQMALKEGLSNEYKPDVYWKMAVCYKNIDEMKKANVAFDLVEKLLHDEEELLLLQRDRNAEYNHEIKLESKETPHIHEPHELFSNASKKIKIKFTPDLGRHVVANDEVKTGDLLVFEPPYASCLLPDMFGSHCHHCFVRLIAPVGCQECSGIAFCTQKCRNEAVSSYHKHECRIMDLLIGSGLSVLSLLALRMVTQYPLDKCLDTFKNKSEEKVYTLCTNSHLRHAKDFFQRTLMAIFLLRCLQEVNYFGRNNKETQSEEELQICELLLLNLQLLQFNAHEIHEKQHSPENRFRGSRTVNIGIGVYPTVALFNHQCYPAVVRYFLGKNIVINAVRPIAKEEIISENYGPVFTRKGLCDRQRSLTSRYWFKCDCIACLQDWPVITSRLQSIAALVRCPNAKCANTFSLPIKQEKVICPKCDHSVNLTGNMKRLQWCEQQYEMASKELTEQRPKEAMNLLTTAIDEFHRVSSPPHQLTHLAQETLWACLNDQGNAYEIIMP